MAKKSELRVRFKGDWHADIGSFLKGCEVALAADIVKALAKEGLVEILDPTPEEKAD